MSIFHIWVRFFTLNCVVDYLLLFPWVVDLPWGRLLSDGRLPARKRAARLVPLHADLQSRRRFQKPDHQKKKASFVWLPLKKSSTMRSGHHEFYPARPPPVGRTRKRNLHILSTGAALGKWGLVWLLEFFLMKMNMLSPFSTLPSSSFVTYFCSI
jgi:hypothetical protein